MSNSIARASRAPAGLALALLAAGCGEASDGNPVLQSARAAGASVAAEPLEVTAVAWGRLVDVYDWDAARGTSELRLPAVAIGPDVVTDGVDYRLARDAVAGRDELVVLHPGGSEAFAEALRRAERALVPIHARSTIDPRLDGARPVARDGVLVLGFDEALDPRAVRAGVVQVAVGRDGPPRPAPGLRVLGDSNHGRHVDVDGDGVAEWAPARILVDLATDELEALVSPVPLDPGAGLPADVVASVSVGGATVVAAFRTAGGPEGIVGGFGPPLVIGDQGVNLTQVALQPGGTYRVDLGFVDPHCALAAEPRDLVLLPGAVLQVLSGGAPSGSAVSLVARLYGGDPSAVVPGPAVFRSAWILAAGDPPECFVRTVPSATTAEGIDPNASFALRFSEAMDLSSFRPMESVALRRTGAASPLEEAVVGTLVVDPDLRGVTFQPALPLDHAAGVGETYLFDALGFAQGLHDLTGTPMQQDLEDVPFRIAADAPAVDTGGIVLRFGSTDEDGNGAPELRGQFLSDLTATRVRPRRVARFSAQADGSTLTTAAMTPLTTGVSVPLNPLGAHMQGVWRYVDLGFSLQDEAAMNLDVEGLAWAPVGGQVVADSFAGFEMALGHAARAPDEVRDATLLGAYPDSGLGTLYADNQADGLTVVHPRDRGYVVDPADVFLASTGTPMIPWPLNRGVPADQFRYFTWRDTRVQEVGGDESAGVDPQIVYQLAGIPPPAPVYPPGQVPTLGLPLLMDFKVFPDDLALGLNALRVALPLNTSPRPEFRAFSAGGVNASGATVLVDPDLDGVAQGGFNPGSGAPTLPRDNAFYFGQADFVVRVNVIHTIWFDTGSTSTQFVDPIATEDGVLPGPAGTQVVVALRGADDTGALGAQADAGLLDPYGDALPQFPLLDPDFFQGDDTWKANASDLDGARHVQARVTIVSNAATGETTSIDALGIAFGR